MSVRTYPVLESQPQPLQGKIFQQIPKIMAEIEAIEKAHQNTQQNFKFRSIDDVYAELHPRLAKHGVFTVPEVLDIKREQHTTKSGALMNYTLATIKYTFYADDGSSFYATVIGEAADSGDKASNKAMSMAHKYCLVKVFLIPTVDDKDPDQHSHEIVGSSVPRVTVNPNNTAHATPLPRPSGLSGVNVDKPISEAQQKRLFAISSQNGWSTEQMKQLLKLYLGIDSSKLIHWKDYEAVCNAASFAPGVVLGSLGVPSGPGPIETTESGWRGDGE